MGSKREKAYLKLQKCPICGRKFIPSAHHVYSDHRSYGKRLVCSWGCVCESERLLREREEEKRKIREERKEKKK